MGRIARYAGLLLAAYALFLLVQFPAARGVALLEQRGLLPLALYQVSGTIWHGRAAAAAAGRLEVEDLAWDFRPLAALAGRAELAVSCERGAGRVAGRVGRALNGTLYVRDLTAALPLAELDALTPGRPAGLRGALAVRLDELEIRAGRIARAAGVIDASDTALGPPLNAALGNFTLTLETTAEGIKAALRDGGGPLQAEGLLTLRGDGSYQFSAAFAARDPARSDLRQALGWLGPADARGRVAVTHSGTLALDQYLAR